MGVTVDYLGIQYWMNSGALGVALTYIVPNLIRQTSKTIVKTLLSDDIYLIVFGGPK